MTRLSIMILSIMTLNAECLLSIAFWNCYVECRYAECRYAECRYTERWYAARRYAECRFTAIHNLHKYMKT
jgi:hypothetical protein